MRFRVGDLVGTRGGDFGVVRSINEGLRSPYRVWLLGYPRTEMSIVCDEDEMCRAINNFVAFVRCGDLR